MYKYAGNYGRLFVFTRLVFNDDTFNVSGKVNRYNVCIWGLRNPNTTLQHERDSVKINLYCAIYCTKVYGPFFFADRTAFATTYLDILKKWLFPQLMEDSQNFIFLHDGALLMYFDVQQLLNQSFPQRWIGCTGNQDVAVLPWPLGDLLILHRITYSCGVMSDRLLHSTTTNNSNPPY